MFKRGFKTWCENASLDVRRRLNLKAVDPVDLKELALKLGAKIVYPENVPGFDRAALRTLTQSDPDSWSALTIKSGEQVVIVLNSTHSSARQMSDLAHELSHLLIGHESSAMSMSKDGLLLTTFDRQQEDEAAWLAGCLLLPREACLHVGRRRIDARIIARQYGISQDMLKFRLQVTGANRQVGGWPRKRTTFSKVA